MFILTEQTVIETDASDFALGCILSQYLGKPLHPVAFHSRKLNPAERKYEIHYNELVALLETFRQWKHSLLGADCYGVSNILRTSEHTEAVGWYFGEYV